MKSDVLSWANSQPTEKPISKETLNHRGLVEMVSGLDAYADTPQAFLRAYLALGLDLINRVPLENAPPPTPPGQTRSHPTMPYQYAPLGIYDTFMRHSYDTKTPDDVWALNTQALNYATDIFVPVPHPCQAQDVRKRQAALGNVGAYYPMLYTTLFMWAVEVLGWEAFMITASLEPDRFFEHFLKPCIAKSRDIVNEIAEASTTPFVFVHDDLAMATGPVFSPAWYDDYIFPHYPAIWDQAKRMGKKIIFVADGDMSVFLPKLVQAGADGIMFETPATPLEQVIEHFGQPGRFFIGGIATSTLTFGQPDQIRAMVHELCAQAAQCPGFVMASGGGLHGNIPLKNLEVYFDARAELGLTPRDWRTVQRA